MQIRTHIRVGGYLIRIRELQGTYDPSLTSARACAALQVEHYRVILPAVFALMGDPDPSVQVGWGTGSVLVHGCIRACGRVPCLPPGRAVDACRL